MKKLILAATLIAASATMNAQALLDNPDNHSYFGARVGLDISSASQSCGIFNNRAGFHAGAIYHLPMYMNLYFEPGLSFFYDTFGMSSSKLLGTEVVEKQSGYLSNMGFRIPFNFGYHFDLVDDISVSVFTGPQLNLSFRARYELTPTIITDEGAVVQDKVSKSAFGSEGFKHVDLQWNIGVGVSYKNYYLSVVGSPGVTKVMSNDYYSFRRNLFEVTLGYNF